MGHLVTRAREMRGGRRRSHLATEIDATSKSQLPFWKWTSSNERLWTTSDSAPIAQQACRRAWDQLRAALVACDGLRPFVFFGVARARGASPALNVTRTGEGRSDGIVLARARYASRPMRRS